MGSPSMRAAPRAKRSAGSTVLKLRAGGGWSRSSPRPLRGAVPHRTSPRPLGCSPCSPVRAGQYGLSGLLGREAQRPVQPDHLAVEVVVLGDLLDQLRVLGRAA